MRRLVVFLYMYFMCSSTFAATTFPRTIVTTDGELDDVDSFIRMLLYSNEFHLEGLVISSSMWHYKGDGKGTRFTSEMEMTKRLYGERTELRWPGEQWIYDLVDAYGQVYPKLKLHASTYPAPDYLRSIIRIGNIEFEGEMAKNTPGSDFIKQKLLDADESPLYLQAWGGTNTIARALKSIEEEYRHTGNWASIYKRINRKAVIYTILDQDATYRNYISKQWPEVKIYYNARQFWALAYFWKRAVPTALHPYLEGKFMGEHIINNHGPLLKKYHSYGDKNPPLGELEDIYSDPTKIKKNQWGSFTPYDFISEGDSPAFLHLTDVGLDNLEHPEYGGWGGRLIRSKTNPNRWEDGDAAADYNPFADSMDLAYAQTRWIPQLQNDFAARADWCIMDYKQANHPPKIILSGPTTRKVKRGQSIVLSADATDSDGHPVSFIWWPYQEVGTYPGKLTLKDAQKKSLRFTVPDDLKKGQTIHLILEVTDQHSLPLTRYKRVVLVGK